MRPVAARVHIAFLALRIAAARLYAAYLRVRLSHGRENECRLRQDIIRMGGARHLMKYDEEKEAA